MSARWVAVGWGLLSREGGDYNPLPLFICFLSPSFIYLFAPAARAIRFLLTHENFQNDGMAFFCFY